MGLNSLSSRFIPEYPRITHGAERIADPQSATDCSSGKMARKVLAGITIFSALLTNDIVHAAVTLLPMSWEFRSSYDLTQDNYIAGTKDFTLTYQTGDRIGSIRLCENSCSDEFGSSVTSPGGGVQVETTDWRVSHECIDTTYIYPTAVAGQFTSEGQCSIDVSYRGYEEARAVLAVEAYPNSTEGMRQIYSATLTGSADDVSPVARLIEGTISFRNNDDAGKEGSRIRIPVVRTESDQPFGQISTISFTAEPINGRFTNSIVSIGAIENVDYQFVGNKVLVWEPGEASTKYLEIELLSDSIREETEGFRIFIDDSAGPVNEVGLTGSTEVYIHDDTPALNNTVLTFSPTTMRGQEGDSQELRISRTGTAEELEATTTVILYIDEALSADVQVDEASSYGLYWYSGQTDEKTVTVTFLNDSLDEGEEVGNLTAQITELRDYDEGEGVTRTQTIPLTITEIPAVTGEVSFVNNPVEFSEDSGEVSLSIQRAGGTDGALSVDYSFVDGSAINGQDFTGESGRLEWADGVMGILPIPLEILTDGVLEATESFSITLSNQQSSIETGTETVSATATVSILDNTNAGQLRIAESTERVSESAGTLSMDVERFGGSDGELTVDYEITGIEAQPGQDYLADQGTLRWTAGQQGARPVLVTLVVDDVVEPDESFSIRLFNSTGVASVPITISESIVTIVDDSEPVGTVGFTTASDREVLEGADTTLSLARVGGSAGALSVTVETVDDTAQSDEDYVSAVHTISWEDGESGVKEFTIATLSDRVFEDTERIIVRIAGTRPDGIAAGTTSIAIRVINDAGNPGVLSFVKPDYEVREDEAIAELLVQRMNGSDGRVTVKYSTVADSADQSDFTPITGELVWADGDTSRKPVKVDIKSDSLDEESTEQFFVSLSNTTPLDDVEQLREPSRATVRIINVVPNPTLDGGVLSADGSGVTVDESAALASIPIERLLASEGRVSVDFQTQGESAIEGQDFTSVSGTLTWEDGDDSTMYIEVPISTDVEVEGLEAFTVILSSPRSDDDNVRVSLETGSVPVNIVDTTSIGSIQFADGTDGMAIRENAGLVDIAVERVDGSDGVVTIDYIISGREAVVGSDARVADVSLVGSTNGRGSLTWAAGDASPKFIKLEIIYDNSVEDDETFAIELLNPRPASMELVSPQAVLTLNNVAPVGTVLDPGFRLTAQGNSVISGIPGQTIDSLTVEAPFDFAGEVVAWRVVPEGAVSFLVDDQSEEGVQTIIDQNGQSSISVLIESRGYIQIVASPVATSSNTSMARGAATSRALPPPAGLTEADVLFVVRSGFQAASGLTGNQSATGSALDEACERLSADSTDEVTLTAGEQDLLATCDKLQLLEETGDNETLARALDRLAPEEVFSFADTLVDVADIQITNIYSRINSIRKGVLFNDVLDVSNLRLNVTGDHIPGGVVEAAQNALSGGGASADGIAGDSRWGVFANGEISIGEVDGNGIQRNADLNTSGLTLGVDYRLLENVVVGAGLGLVVNDTDFTGEEGKASSDGLSLSLYGTWYEADEGYADVVLDIGRYSYDMSRRIDLPLPGELNQLAKGSTDATSISLTVGVGRDFNAAGWDFGPYGRISLISGSIDGFSENIADPSISGTGSLLDISSHSVKSARISLGGQVSRVINTRRGVVLPQLRVEIETESEDSKDPVAAVFQSDPTETSFTLKGNARDQRFVNIGLGSSFIFKNGKSAFIFYETRAQHDFVSQQSLKVGLRLEF